MSKKIATLITDYFEDTEYTEPAEAFKQKGYELTTIEAKKVKRYTVNKEKVKL